MSGPAPATGAAPSLAAAALRGLCPRCGAPTLFAGIARFANRCSSCNLDFADYNVGDGPAAFLILVVGAIVVTGALIVDQGFGPPWWVHLAWIPVAAALTILGLRAGKSALLFQAFRHRAGEGRLAE